MDLRIICFVLDRLVLAESAVLCVPLLMALAWGEASASAFLLTLFLAAVLGGVLAHCGKVKPEKLTAREGVAITGLGWALVTAVGMLPYLLGGYTSFLEGLFESISGFTGTGATVLEHLDSLLRSLLFWRSMTHWFGGLGIIVIFIALLPQSGQSTVYMYNAEATGPTKDRLVPHIKDMTAALFRIYLLLTVLCFFVYRLCGMDTVTAANHALSTIGAGGFSTYDDSARAFGSLWVEGWMSFFMVLAGVNFGLYYKVFRKGPGKLWKNTEFKAYLLILLLASAAIVWNLMDAMGYSPSAAVRYAVFQVTSLETTGFVSADYDQWPGFSKGVLLMLMMVGGCAGSTTSGLKVSRVVLLLKGSWNIVLSKASPRSVHVVRMNGHTVDPATIHRASAYFFLYISCITVFGLLMTADGLPLFDAMGISVSALGNIGPAFGIAGATCTYAALPVFTKCLLCLEMLLGRLEIYTLLVMLRPEFWRRRQPW